MQYHSISVVLNIIGIISNHLFTEINQCFQYHIFRLSIIIDSPFHRTNICLNYTTLLSYCQCNYWLIYYSVKIKTLSAMNNALRVYHAVTMYKSTDKCTMILFFTDRIRLLPCWLQSCRDSFHYCVWAVCSPGNGFFFVCVLFLTTYLLHGWHINNKLIKYTYQIIQGKRGFLPEDRL